MNPLLKHATASVFLVTHIDAAWRIGLIQHPRLQRWMLPGGHVEPDENPAEAAMREVREETGILAELLDTHADGLSAAMADVLLPIWIAEQRVPPESRHAHPHVHVDHQYLAVAVQREPVQAAELQFGWFAGHELGELGMFPESFRGARLLLGSMDVLGARPPAEIA
ncbi:NUDIX hydrolase [Krasilnikovia sp. MM14-A1259]|uniref:NUDIX hydrolase n=1 Tax=Krasilnikovia sp. MM14-A1259 TaxID=3373539 RepID=UPI003806B41A